MRQNPELDAGKEVSFHRLHEVEAGKFEVLHSQRVKDAETRLLKANNSEKLASNPYGNATTRVEHTDRKVGRVIAGDTSDFEAEAQSQVDQAYLEALEDQSDAKEIAA